MNSHVLLFDYTFDTPEENLACDEALLDACDAGEHGGVLRFWMPSRMTVVVGVGDDVQREVRTDVCAARGIPVLRRCTGGGAVVLGPGCLAYSLIFPIGSRPEWRTIQTTNEHILARHAGAVAPVVDRLVAVRGHTDLALGDRKFSGNASRRRRNAVLFHGTFLIDFDVDAIDMLLPQPTREPDYRRGRSHRTFLANLCVPVEALRSALAACWSAESGVIPSPESRVEYLVRTRYGNAEWTWRR